MLMLLVKVGKKMVPILTTDLGQGVLRVMEDVHKELNPDMHNVGGYLLSKDE